MFPRRVPPAIAEVLGDAGGVAYCVIDELRRCRGTISAKGLADILGVDKKLIYGMIDKGEIEPIRLGSVCKVIFDPRVVTYQLCRSNPMLAKASGERGRRNHAG